MNINKVVVPKFVVEIEGTIHIGKCSDIESIINRVKNRFNSFIGSEVIHRNTHYVVRDVNVKSYNEKLAIIIKVDPLNKYTELKDVLYDVMIKVLEEDKMNKHKGERLTTLGFGIPNLLKFGEVGYFPEQFIVDFGLQGKTASEIQKHNVFLQHDVLEENTNE